MGDALDSRFREAGRTAEGGGITLPQLFEMTRPGASEQKKGLCPLGIFPLHFSFISLREINPVFVSSAL